MFRNTSNYNPIPITQKKYQASDDGLFDDPAGAMNLKMEGR